MNSLCALKKWKTIGNSLNTKGFTLRDTLQKPTGPNYINLSPVLAVILQSLNNARRRDEHDTWGQYAPVINVHPKSSIEVKGYTDSRKYFFPVYEYMYCTLVCARVESFTSIGGR